MELIYLELVGSVRSLFSLYFAFLFLELLLVHRLKSGNLSHLLLQGQVFALYVRNVEQPLAQVVDWILWFGFIQVCECLGND